MLEIIHKLRVFVNENNKFGNHVGIIIDVENNINKHKRQTIATKLGFSESVFINKLNPASVSIFNPQREISFAGHAMVGAAWFLKQFHNQKINFIDCAGGRIKTWEVNGFTWIQAGLSSMPPWQFEQLKDIVAVETFPTKKALLKKHTFVWAWQDKNKGIIRARTFAPDWGIPEDEANGSGAMKLSAKLRSKITVIHGQGSVIYANFAGAGLVEVGGRVAELLV